MPEQRGVERGNQRYGNCAARSGLLLLLKPVHPQW